MSTLKKATFCIVLVVVIAVSIIFTFNSIARDTYEFKQEENIGEVNGLNGWMFYGFNGNTNTTSVQIDYVRDKNGKNPDTSRPVVAVNNFTIVSDEYVEFITIGKDVQYISEQAFYYCKKLKAVYVDEENPYFTSVDGSLYTKDKKTLVLHPICNLDWLAEKGITKTNDTFDIPEGVENIGGYSFYKNDKLVHLTFPSTLKSIGDMSFFGCSSMWSIWLPEGLESIGNDAFSNDWCMSPIMYIPSTVTHIGHDAFFNCSGVSVFYMGAKDDSGIEFGESWLPKSIKKGIINKTPELIYGKTLEDALAEKSRIDNAD